MTRMQVRLEDDDKRWLEFKALRTGTSMAEIVRQAIRRARLTELLETTKGIWRQGDGLRYQRRLRAEWR
jgi:hypothetical protein